MPSLTRDNALVIISSGLRDCLTTIITRKKIAISTTKSVCTIVPRCELLSCNCWFHESSKLSSDDVSSILCFLKAL